MGGGGGGGPSGAGAGAAVAVAVAVAAEGSRRRRGGGGAGDVEVAAGLARALVQGGRGVVLRSLSGARGVGGESAEKRNARNLMGLSRVLSSMVLGSGLVSKQSNRLTRKRRFKFFACEKKAVSTCTNGRPSRISASRYAARGARATGRIARTPSRASFARLPRLSHHNGVHRRACLRRLPRDRAPHGRAPRVQGARDSRRRRQGRRRSERCATWSVALSKSDSPRSLSPPGRRARLLLRVVDPSLAKLARRRVASISI